MLNSKALFARRRDRTRYDLRRKAKRPDGTMLKRLSVFRSSKHIYAQLIDDMTGHTLASASSVDKELRDTLAKGTNREAAAAVGELLAKRALEAGCKEVVFDRGGYKYHGRVQALAEAARAHGLKF